MKKLVIIGHKDDCVQLRSGYDFRGNLRLKPMLSPEEKQKQREQRTKFLDAMYPAQVHFAGQNLMSGFLGQQQTRSYNVWPWGI